jgi:hypothetical protein
MKVNEICAGQSDNLRGGQGEPSAERHTKSSSSETKMTFKTRLRVVASTGAIPVSVGDASTLAWRMDLRTSFRRSSAENKRAKTKKKKKCLVCHGLHVQIELYSKEPRRGSSTTGKEERG